VTSGGRVLCVVGLGDTVAQAAQDAYAAVDKIDWDAMYFRRDIGHRAIARENG
jgi:phosphoribosylamine--glycine ligase